MKPPGTLAFQTSWPVSASSAQSVPFQSPKYAIPPATVGVPVTPTSPSFDQLLVSFVTVVAVIWVSFGFSLVFERSWP